MKSRLAILAMLVAGMLFSTAGAGLAVSGFSSQQQRQRRRSTAASQRRRRRQRRRRPARTSRQPGAAATSTSGSRARGDRSPPARSRPARRAPAASQLPFTGFAAIPVLLGGIALLTRRPRAAPARATTSLSASLAR